MTSACYKVITLGKAGVGKTSIMQRYTSGSFQQSEETIGAASIKCAVDLTSGPVPLNIWDTAGQEKFQSLIPLYLHGADACLIVFDLTGPSVTQTVDKFFNDIKAHLNSNVLVILCGNKCDLLAKDQEPVEIAEWAQEKQIQYFITSAVSGQGIDELFLAIAAGVKDGPRNAPVSTPEFGEPEKSCCG
jgi:Ras-related protein Rab-5C